MRQFTQIVSTVVIAAGTGWISFGQPSYLHAEETKVEAKVEKIPASDAQPSQTQMQPQQNAVQPNTSMTMGSNSAAGGQVLAKATQASLSNDPIQNLSQCLVSADRQRISSGNADTTQLNQTIDRLKADWKQKYGSDLSTNDLATALSANAMTGGAMSGSTNVDATASTGAQSSARNAGSNMANVPKDNTTTMMPMNPEGRGAGAPRVEATPPSGDAAGSIALNPQPKADPQATGTPAQSPAGDGVQRMSDSPRIDNVANGASADANAAAQTASAKMNAGGNTAMAGGQHSMYTVPATGGMQASSLHLMQEQGEWKIDLDDSVDANTLSTNLNRQLSQASNMKDQWPSQEQDAKRALAHHVAAALSSATPTMTP